MQVLRGKDVEAAVPFLSTVTFPIYMMLAAGGAAATLVLTVHPHTAAVTISCSQSKPHLAAYLAHKQFQKLGPVINSFQQGELSSCLRCAPCLSVPAASTIASLQQAPMVELGYAANPAEAESVLRLAAAMPTASASAAMLPASATCFWTSVSAPGRCPSFRHLAL